MRNVREFLQQEQKNILALAKSFGFENIRFLFDEINRPAPLQLIIEAKIGSDINSACLFEAKLMQRYNVDAVVIIKSAVRNFFSVEIITTHSINAEKDLSEIENWLGKPLGELWFKDREIPLDKLHRRLALADIILSENTEELEPGITLNQKM